MINRREFLARSSLLAFGAAVPQFFAKTAHAIEPGKDTILVVLEMAGGNDGLNTVIPYADDLYYRNRPTLRLSKKEVLKIDDQLGLHPSMTGMHKMLQDRQLAIVQAVGYPNPERSHFEAMDTWQLADPKRERKDGWLARATPLIQDAKGSVPALHLGGNRTSLPLALNGAGGGVISVNKDQPFQLNLTGLEDRQKARRKLLDDLVKGPLEAGNATDFVRRRQVQAYTSMDKLKEILKPEEVDSRPGSSDKENDIQTKLAMIGKLISAGWASRIYYVSFAGFDTHSAQAADHSNLLARLSSAIEGFFKEIYVSGPAERVLLLTFSEFGRRVKENGSQGTDHGAASCQFVAGPAVAAGLVGKHPRLDDLDFGDLKYHTDFRQVYATLLDQWLRCDSAAVLGAKYEHLPLLAKKG
ncbi:MAG TPA: DUF1501 domain-containing protein [Gemmataceae bacterium]|nr:DUF1501 domain-containing protein [Gemmataceae bacterium]